MGYKFKTPDIYKGIDADSAVMELNRIREKYGTLQPEYVVDESRDEESFLHNIFQWDDSRAAESYRREQARKFIGNITVCVSNEHIEISTRALVYVSPAKSEKRSFIPINEVILNKEAYDDLKCQAKEDAESFLNKYKQIEELNAVKAELLKFIAI